MLSKRGRWRRTPGTFARMCIVRVRPDSGHTHPAPKSCTSILSAVIVNTSTAVVGVQSTSDCLEPSRKAVHPNEIGLTCCVENQLPGVIVTRLSELLSLPRLTSLLLPNKQSWGLLEDCKLENMIKLTSLRPFPHVHRYVQTSLCMLCDQRDIRHLSALNRIAAYTVIDWTSSFLNMCQTGSAGPARYVLEHPTASNHFGPVLAYTICLEHEGRRGC